MGAVRGRLFRHVFGDKNFPPMRVAVYMDVIRPPFFELMSEKTHFGNCDFFDRANSPEKCEIHSPTINTPDSPCRLCHSRKMLPSKKKADLGQDVCFDTAEVLFPRLEAVRNARGIEPVFGHLA